MRERKRETVGRCARGMVILGVMLVPGLSLATPSTTFWAPSTPYVQPWGVLHVTYDTYFRENTIFPVDLGLELGVLPWDGIQMEVGFDFLLPTSAGEAPLDAPILLNAKVGGKENAYFDGSPGWSAGIFGIGFKEDVTDYNVVHFMLGKTLPYIGEPEVGVYYGLNEDLFLSSDDEKKQFGVMVGWFSPEVRGVPGIDKLMLTWDIQTGKNVLGATGGGLYVYFTPSIDLLTGPVFFFDNDLQAAHDPWVWTMQLDIDVDVFSSAFKEKAPE